jgi:hypothetical protein
LGSRFENAFYLFKFKFMGLFVLKKSNLFWKLGRALLSGPAGQAGLTRSTRPPPSPARRAPASDQP